ncbi:MAG: BREX-4 system phosphatase PglZ [Candidatus Cryosericum sp.]
MDKLITSTQELQRVVCDDLLSEMGADQRYPWRFVFVPTLWGLKPVEAAVKAALGDRFQTSDVTSEQHEPDSVITGDDVLRLIDKCTVAGGPWLITGLSEVLRFKSDEDFETLIRGITESESHGEDRTQRRFYIPLAGLHERFQKLLWNKAHRESSGLWPASWKVEEQTGSVLRVVLLGQPLDVPTSLTISNYREFLSMWTGPQVESAVVTSPMIADLYDRAPKDVFPDAAVSISRVSGYADYLNVTFGVDVPVPFRGQDMELWHQFAQDMQVAQEPRLRNVLCQRFNVAQPGLADSLEYWPISASDKYSRWLLRVGVCTLYPDSYLAKCLSGLEELDTAALILALLSGPILDKQERLPEWLDERRGHLRALVRSAGQSLDLPKGLQKSLEGLSAVDRLRVLTDTTPWERSQFVLLFADAGVPRDLWFDIVLRAFPLLYDYAAPYRFDGLPEPLSWVNSYFDDYRTSRLVDRPSESLRAQLARVNADETSFYKWYYAARKHDMAGALVDRGSRAVMVDGMGWEWTPFVVRRLRRRGLAAVELAPTAACLPTTTKFNRFDSHVVVTTESLDVVAHRALYKHPQTLLEELEVMDRLVDEQLSEPGTVVVADHGLTAFSRSVASVGMYEMEGIEHEGRCAWLKKAEKTCSDFLVCEVPSKPELPSGPVALALGYTSLGQVGKHLAHGGATPEEVLVPGFIVQAQEDKTRYDITRVTVKDNEASRQVVFAVAPDPITAPKVIVARNETHVAHLADGHWCIQLPSDVAGSVTVEIAVETTVVTWTVTVKSGMTERELF